jgi:hypothetical protein
MAQTIKQKKALNKVADKKQQPVTLLDKFKKVAQYIWNKITCQKV